MYKGIASVQMSHRTERVESGVWESKEKAQAELVYFIGRVLPMRESFKVVQSIINVK